MKRAADFHCETAVHRSVVHASAYPRRHRQNENNPCHVKTLPLKVLKIARLDERKSTMYALGVSLTVVVPCCALRLAVPCREAAAEIRTKIIFESFLLLCLAVCSRMWLVKPRRQRRLGLRGNIKFTTGNGRHLRHTGLLVSLDSHV